MKNRVAPALLIVVSIIILDQITKFAVRTHIHPYETIQVFPMLNLVNVRNEGAAFGMFRSFGNTFFIVMSVAALVFMAWIIVSGKEDYRIFSVLAGGAAGNLIDRLTLGYVVDFVDFTVSGLHWPAFNVADSALSIGIMLLMIRMFRKR